VGEVEKEGGREPRREGGGQRDCVQERERERERENTVKNRIQIRKFKLEFELEYSGT